MRSKVVAPALISSIILGACASGPSSIDPIYVSPSLYADWSCEDLAEERATLGSRARRIAVEQADAATGDAVFMTVGLVVFWPALFGLALTDDQEDELARLRGEYEAVEQAMTRNQCDLPSSDEPSTEADDTDTPTDESEDGDESEA